MKNFIIHVERIYVEINLFLKKKLKVNGSLHKSSSVLGFKSLRKQTRGEIL